MNTFTHGKGKISYTWKSGKESAELFLNGNIKGSSLCWNTRAVDNTCQCLISTTFRLFLPSLPTQHFLSVNIFRFLVICLYSTLLLVIFPHCDVLVPVYIFIQKIFSKHCNKCQHPAPAQITNRQGTGQPSKNLISLSSQQKYWKSSQSDIAINATIHSPSPSLTLSLLLNINKAKIENCLERRHFS